MRQWTTLFLKLFADKPVYLAIDDSIVLRHSKKAPMSQIHHQHGSDWDDVHGYYKLSVPAITLATHGLNNAMVT